MNEKLSRRDVLRRTGRFLGGAALAGIGVEVMKASDNVSREMSHKKFATAVKDAVVDGKGPLAEPTVDQFEMLGEYAGGMVFMAGAALMMIEADLV